MFTSRRPDRSATCPVQGSLPEGRGAFIVTVPGMQAPIYHLDLPEGLSGPARLRVARQQLSDKLGVPANTLDLMPLSLDGVRHWDSVICVDTKQRQKWCATGPAVHKRARAVLPEYLALRSAAETLVACISDGLVHVRLGLADGFSAPPTLAADVLQSALKHHHLKRANLSGDLPQGFIEVVAAAGLPTTTAQAGNDRFDTFEIALDLRKSDTARNSETVKTLRAWVAAISVSLLAFSIWAASVLMEIRTLESDETELRRATVDVLRSGLIPAGPILDTRQQVVQRISAANAEEGSSDRWVLDRLSMLSVALFGKGARVQSIAFDPIQGHSAAVRTRDFATAEALLSDLRDTGFEPVDTSVRAQDDGDVELRFRVPAPVSERAR